MKQEKISVPIKHFPNSLQTYLENATIYDSSSHSEATVLCLDSGYYLKIDKKGALAQEAQCAKWFEKQKIGVPVIQYLSTDKDYLLTQKATGQNASHFLHQPEQLCQTLAKTLRKLHQLKPDNFPADDQLQHYRQTAEENYYKGAFYEQALLPQFQLHHPKEAYQLIQEQGHLLTTDSFIHGDPCLPNIILQDASTFLCFIDVGLAGVCDRHIDLYWVIWSLTQYLNPKYAEVFIDYYGREHVDANKLRLVAAFEAFG